MDVNIFKLKPKAHPQCFECTRAETQNQRSLGVWPQETGNRKCMSWNIQCINAQTISDANMSFLISLLCCSAVLSEHNSQFLLLQKFKSSEPAQLWFFCLIALSPFLFGAGINLNKDTVVNNYTHVLPKLKQTFGNHSGVFYFSCDQGVNFLTGRSPGNRHKLIVADMFRRRSCRGNMNSGVFWMLHPTCAVNNHNFCSLHLSVLSENA